jgi:hypothetical protein
MVETESYRGRIGLKPHHLRRDSLHPPPDADVVQIARDELPRQILQGTVEGQAEEERAQWVTLLDALF